MGSAGSVLGRARVIASVGCGYGVDGEQRHARIEPERCNTHLGGKFASVEHPTQCHRQITIDDDTLYCDWLSRSHGSLAETERYQLRSHCQFIDGLFEKKKSVLHLQKRSHGAEERGILVGKVIVKCDYH